MQLYDCQNKKIKVVVKSINDHTNYKNYPSFALYDKSYYLFFSLKLVTRPNEPN